MLIRRWRKLVIAAIVFATAVPALFVALPSERKAAALTSAVDVAERLLRPTLFRASYRPFYERLWRLVDTGLGSGSDYPNSGEAAAIAAYRRFLRPAPGDRLMFMDGGAFEGEYTDELLANFADVPGIRIHAFEPANAAFTAFSTRFLADTRVTANQLALGEVPGQLELHLGGVPKMNSFVSVEGVTGAATQSAAVVTLDDYAAARGIDRIDILKLDIEGYEWNALRGASRLLAEKRIRIVQFEFNYFALTNHVTFADVAALFGKDADIRRIMSDGLVPVRDIAYWHLQLNRISGNYAVFLN